MSTYQTTVETFLCVALCDLPASMSVHGQYPMSLIVAFFACVAARTRLIRRMRLCLSSFVPQNVTMLKIGGGACALLNASITSNTSSFTGAKFVR